jgi:hypothetical protein
MPFTNERGQYGSSRIQAGASGPSPVPPPAPAGRSLTPWIIGGVGLAVVGLVLLSGRTARGPSPSAHEKEVKEWEAEFPGLPWYQDQVKDSQQYDMWERARDHWERTR